MDYFIGIVKRRLEACGCLICFEFYCPQLQLSHVELALSHTQLALLDDAADGLSPAPPPLPPQPDKAMVQKAVKTSKNALKPVIIHLLFCYSIIFSLLP